MEAVERFSDSEVTGVDALQVFLDEVRWGGWLRVCGLVKGKTHSLPVEIVLRWKLRFSSTKSLSLSLCLSLALSRHRSLSLSFSAMLSLFLSRSLFNTAAIYAAPHRL